MKIKITKDVDLGPEIIKAGSIGRCFGSVVHFDRECISNLPTGELNATYDLDFILTLPHEIIRKEG